MVLGDQQYLLGRTQPQQPAPDQRAAGQVEARLRFLAHLRVQRRLACGLGQGRQIRPLQREQPGRLDPLLRLALHVLEARAQGLVALHDPG